MGQGQDFCQQSPFGGRRQWSLLLSAAAREGFKLWSCPCCKRQPGPASPLLHASFCSGGAQPALELARLGCAACSCSVKVVVEAEGKEHGKDLGWRRGRAAQSLQLPPAPLCPVPARCQAAPVLSATASHLHVELLPPCPHCCPSATQHPPGTASPLLCHALSPLYLDAQHSQAAGARDGDVTLQGPAKGGEAALEVEGQR